MAGYDAQPQAEQRRRPRQPDDVWTADKRKRRQEFAARVRAAITGMGMLSVLAGAMWGTYAWARAEFVQVADYDRHVVSAALEATSLQLVVHQEQLWTLQDRAAGNSTPDLARRIRQLEAKVEALEERNRILQAKALEQ